MSVTITSTVNNKTYNIKLTKHIVNICDNIFNLDGTSTDVKIPTNINDVLKYTSTTVMDFHKTNDGDKPLYELFGINQTIVTRSQLELIEGYLYDELDDELVIEGDMHTVIKEIPFGMKRVIVQNCPNLTELSAIAMHRITVTNCNALTKLFVVGGTYLSVTNCSSLTEAYLANKHIVSFAGEIKVQSCNKLTELHLVTEGDVVVENNELLKEFAIGLDSEDETKVPVPVEQNRHTVFFEKMLALINEHLANE